MLTGRASAATAGRTSGEQGIGPEAAAAATVAAADPVSLVSLSSAPIYAHVRVCTR